MRSAQPVAIAGTNLDASIEQLTALGRGVVVYLRSRQRAMDLQACALQGADGREGSVQHARPVEDPDYRAAAGILSDLGVESVVLLAYEPAVAAALRRYGIAVPGAVQVGREFLSDDRPPRREGAGSAGSRQNPC